MFQRKCLCRCGCEGVGGPKNVCVWGCKHVLGVFQRPLTLTLLQAYHDINASPVVIQIGGVYTTFCQEEGILLQKYRDRNGRCSATLFKSIGVGGRFDSPECVRAHVRTSAHISEQGQHVIDLSCKRAGIGCPSFAGQDFAGSHLQVAFHAALS